jgi:hypothetical protein
MCLQPSWANAACAGVAATGALSPRDLAPWSCRKAQIRWPAECAAWSGRVMASLQDCILQEPRPGGQERNSREPAAGMLSHLLLCSRLAWKLYPRAESIAGKAGLTIRNRSRRSNTEKLPLESTELMRVHCSVMVAGYSLVQYRAWRQTSNKQASRQRVRGDLGVGSIAAPYATVPTSRCVQLELLTITTLSTSPMFGVCCQDQNR